jgi:hypothetical protein
LVRDILNLISNFGIDPAGEEFTADLSRYANDETQRLLLAFHGREK